MDLDVRTAVLEEATEQRLRLAISLLGAYRLRIRLNPWDGTRCDLLIASADDAYGARVLAQAQRRGTKAIGVGRTLNAAISPDATAAMLAQHIRDQVYGAASSDASAASAPLPALCRLAQPPLRGKAVDVICHGRALKLRPQTGRVHAESHSGLLAGLEKLSESRCRIVLSDGDDDVQNMASASIESVLLRAAYRIGDALPDFPAGRYWLDAWPDLGVMPLQTGALRTCLLLIGNTRSSDDLVKSDLGDVTPADLNACLWAFAAADLLRDDGVVRRIETAPPRKPRAHASFLSSLARRFGLRRA